MKKKLKKKRRGRKREGKNAKVREGIFKGHEKEGLKRGIEERKDRNRFKGRGEEGCVRKRNERKDMRREER